MLKNKLAIETKINDRIYSLELDPQSPLGEAFDALTQLRGYVADRIAEENKKSTKQTESPTEVV